MACVGFGSWRPWSNLCRARHRRDPNGVYGASTSPSGRGVYGINTSNGGHAGYFEGDVHVTGSLTKGSGTFKIDHPLDPQNKYLAHSFVESPDMMNVYNGTIILDAQGEALVELPAYFEALNRDFRYQLTSIGGFAPVYIAEEIQGNHFKIAGGTPPLDCPRGGESLLWSASVVGR